jgi:hypothetical protein
MLIPRGVVFEVGIDAQFSWSRNDFTPDELLDEPIALRRAVGVRRLI